MSNKLFRGNDNEQIIEVVNSEEVKVQKKHSWKKVLTRVGIGAGAVGILAAAFALGKKSNSGSSEELTDDEDDFEYSENDEECYEDDSEVDESDEN